MERQAKDGTFYKQVGDDEWEPITRQAKDGTVYKKVGADDWEPFESAPKSQEPESRDSIGDVGVAAQRGVLFGARPFVAGVGGGLGAIAERFDRNDEAGFLDRVSEIPEQFQKGFADQKKAAQDEESELQERRPGLVMAGDIGGALLTAPLAAAKGVQVGAQAANAGRLAKAAQTAKTIGQGAGQAAKVGGAMGAAHALGHAENSGEAIESIGLGALAGAGGQTAFNIAGKAAPKIFEASKTGAKKIASGMTGVSEKEIDTYFKRSDEVKKLFKQAGGELSEAADQVRQKIFKDIQGTRQRLNNQISTALKDPKYQAVVVDGRAIIQRLDDELGRVSKITASFKGDEVNELKNVRDLVVKSMGPNGELDVNTLNQLKAELQDIAQASYNNGGQIFTRGKLAAQASKGAAAEARRLLNAAAPEIKEANNGLSKLHLIEKRMNKNLIAEGKPEAALMAAGSGANPRNAKFLSELDSMTGGDALRQAENLAAGRTFNNTPIMPMDSTGKAAARILTGGGIGYVTGGEQGGMIGAALASPAALKGAITAARAGSKVANALGGQLGKVAPQAANRPAVVGNLSSKLTHSNSTQALPRVAEENELDKDSSRPAIEQKSPEPKKGPERWMRDGAKNLENSGVDVAALRESKKGQQLLIEASTLKPGSKAMQSLIARIEKHSGGRN